MSTQLVATASAPVPSAGRPKVLVLGATSGIARGIAANLAPKYELTLGARNREEAERVASDLRVRQDAVCEVIDFDALDYETHADLFANEAWAGVVYAVGFMPDQDAAQRDFSVARRTVEANYLSAISLLEAAAQHFEAQGSGFIAAVSSVAGDRGRQSNYIYGSSKAALTAYLSGLRNRLAGSNVDVLTVKPGFVYTAMTRGLLDPASPLVADPFQVGSDVSRAIEKRRSEIYTPWFWGWIMRVIRSIPEALFKKLSL